MTICIANGREKNELSSPSPRRRWMAMEISAPKTQVDFVSTGIFDFGALVLWSSYALRVFNNVCFFFARVPCSLSLSFVLVVRAEDRVNTFACVSLLMQHNSVGALNVFFRLCGSVRLRLARTWARTPSQDVRPCFKCCRTGGGDASHAFASSSSSSSSLPMP